MNGFGFLLYTTERNGCLKFTLLFFKPGCGGGQRVGQLLQAFALTSRSSGHRYVALTCAFAAQIMAQVSSTARCHLTSRYMKPSGRELFSWKLID